MEKPNSTQTCNHCGRTLEDHSQTSHYDLNLKMWVPFLYCPGPGPDVGDWDKGPGTTFDPKPTGRTVFMAEDQRRKAEGSGT